MVAPGIENLSPNLLPAWGHPGDLKCSHSPSLMGQNVTADLVSRGLHCWVQQVLLISSAHLSMEEFLCCRTIQGIAGRAELWRQY